VVVFIGEELLVTKLKHFRVLVVDVVDVLIKQVHSLAIFLHYKLRPFRLTLLVVVRDDEHVVEGSPSNGLGKI